MKWQIYWQIYPLVLASIGQKWQFYISSVRDDIADLLADQPSGTGI